MTTYHYQCAGCGCTLHAEPEKAGEEICYVMNGELCPYCQSKQQEQHRSAQSQNDDFDY